LATVQAARSLLDSGRPISSDRSLSRDHLADLSLLTAKQFIYVFNVDEAAIADQDLAAKLADLVVPAPSVLLSARAEAELVELEPADAAELLHELGQDETGLARLARVGFEALGLMTFLTAGPKEARAWTIRRGATAPEAAGVIHSDFQRGFIKAEVVSFDELVAAGSLAQARAAGKVRIEGRDYVMRDGDVVEFRFNV
jgi:ribosome-binding ATPase YchF (GTP1/OBG family)